MYCVLGSRHQSGSSLLNYFAVISLFAFDFDDPACLRMHSIIMFERRKHQIKHGIPLKEVMATLLKKTVILSV